MSIFAYLLHTSHPRYCVIFSAVLHCIWFLSRLFVPSFFFTLLFISFYGLRMGATLEGNCSLMVFFWHNDEHTADITCDWIMHVLQWTGITMQAAGESCGASPYIRGTSAWSCVGCTQSTASTLSSESTSWPIPTFPTRASSEWVFIPCPIFANCIECVIGLGWRHKLTRRKATRDENGIKCFFLPFLYVYIYMFIFYLFLFIYLFIAVSSCCRFFFFHSFSQSYFKKYIFPSSASFDIFRRRSCIPIWIFASSKSDEK